MKVIEVVGNKGNRERLISRLKQRGNLAIVEHGEGTVGTEEKGRVESTVVRTSSVALKVTKNKKDDPDPRDSDLRQALDRLADDGIDYAVVEGFDDAKLNTVEVDEERDMDRILDNIEELEDYETLGSLVNKIKKHPDSPKAGAISTFTGRVRVKNHEDTETTHLNFEKYDNVADEKMEDIRQEIKNRDGVYEVLLYHKTGVVMGEEDIVHVVVLAGHREEVFKAVKDGINRLKDEVPIFKKEVTESGEYWVHNRP